jgi:hypothetical protein
MKKEKLYECKACNMKYLSKELAKKCEDFCIKHKACSTEITKHAIQPNE